MQTIQLALAVSAVAFLVFGTQASAQTDTYTTPPAAAPAAPKKPPAAKPAQPKPQAGAAAAPAKPSGTAGAAAASGQAPAAAKPKPVAVVSPAKFLEKHDDWMSYMHEAQGTKICFAAAVPKESEPKAAKRGAVYFYLTNWPKDGIRNEASVSIGYPIKPDGSVKVIVGGQEFEFFGRQDKAFIKDPATERKLVEAMSSNSTMTVKGVSARGTETTDTYSLAGLSAAVKKIAQACP